MSRNTHPVELLLLALLVTIEALAVLLAAALALLLTIARRSRQQRPAPQPPALHPLAGLAEQLVATHSRRELQTMAGTRTNLSKARLAALAVAC